MIVAYTGYPGSGKTYCLVLEALKAINKGISVYSNFRIDIPELTLISDADLLEVREGLVLLDELNVWFPSRFWSKVPMSLLSFWAQSRKRGIDIFYTTQHINRVDTVIRELTSFEVKCSSIFGGRIFLYRKYDIDDKTKLSTRVVIFRKRIADLYDTLETIQEPEYFRKIKNNNKDLSGPYCKGGRS